MSWSRTLMTSFVNLITFIESSHSRLRSLVTTLLFSTSALPWVMQSKPSQAVVVHNSVVILMSFASRTLLFSSGKLFSMCWIHLLDVQWCTNPLRSPALGIYPIHQLVGLHHPVWLYVIVSLQFNELLDRPDLPWALVGGGQLDHRNVPWQRGDA